MNLRTDCYDDACQLIKTYHYSKRVPANVQIAFTWHEDGGLFGDAGRPVAACLFSIPPTRWSETIWELSRLVRREDISIPLSSFISKAIKHLRAKKSIDLLVSFADATFDHHGGIYQACSWNYAGKRERRLDGLLVNGRFIPGRSCNSSWGTRSPRLMAEKHPEWSIEPHYDEGKYLYWLPLSRGGAKKAERLGLTCLPYPKPKV